MQTILSSEEDLAIRAEIPVLPVLAVCQRGLLHGGLPQWGSPRFCKRGIDQYPARLSGGFQSLTEINAQLRNAPQEHCYACIGTRGCAGIRFGRCQLALTRIPRQFSRARIEMEEQEQNMMKEEKTEKMPKAMVELQVDELSAEEIPTVQTEESSEDPSDSVTEILEPENKEMPVKEETAQFESGEADRSGADQDGSDMYGEQDAGNSADPVSDTPSDSFEENTMYVRTDESREEPHPVEHASEDGMRAGTARSEENSYDQTVRYTEDPHYRNFRSEEDSSRQKSGSGEDVYGRSFEDTYRRDGGMDADWRRRASRTNDTSGNFDSEREDRNMTITALRRPGTAEWSISRIPSLRRMTGNRLPGRRKKENADGSLRGSQQPLSQQPFYCSSVSALSS